MEKKHSQKDNSQQLGKTLFVKFFPPSALITRQHLSDHFSNYGPVNRCSVIRQSKPKLHQAAAGDTEDEKANLDRGSKGYGFVRFVHEDDAKLAADTIKKKSTGGKKNGGEIMIVDGVQYRIHAERAVDAAAGTSGSNAAPSSTQKKGKKYDDNAATKASYDSSLTKETKTAAIIDASKGDADSKFKAESKRKRTSRVIIRNLSFYANEKHVKSAMETNFGPVATVDLPLVPSLPNHENNDKGKHKKNSAAAAAALPRHRGFAFVTFTNANAAKQAVERGGEIKIKNRLVAIDFSVSKLEHQKMMKEGQNQKDAGDTENESESESENEADDDSDKKEEVSDDDSEDDGEDVESSESESEDDEGENDEESSQIKDANNGTLTKNSKTPEFDDAEAKRTLFLRNIPFDATRHDVFELFRQFGRVEAVYLVKDNQTGVFKGTAFVRFENVKGCAAAMEASGVGKDATQTEPSPESAQFVSSKNIAMGLGEGNLSGLTLKGRNILVDFAVDRTTASSLAIQRDADGKPIKKMVGKDRRNLYLKNEGRVSSAADSGDAKEASAKHGGMWEDLPPSDRAKRERAFADKSTKLRSPLFFINPYRISIRNLAKEINEAELKKLVFEALQTGLKGGLATPKDAVAHWRAGGDMAHSEVMRRATDANLVTPPVNDKNIKECVTSVFIDRDVSGGKKTADAPSRGFGFVEFAHHTHALAVLRQLNNNPIYSKQFAAGGKHASEMAKHKRGKKAKKTTADPETGVEFRNEDGKVLVPRLIVEFAVSTFS
jgi:nucleolar protein 4